MRYRRGYKSKDTEYRGSSRGKQVAGGVGGLGIIGVLLAAVFGAFGGGGGGGFDIGSALEDLDAGPAPQSSGTTEDLPPRNDFLEFVFDDVQMTWDELFTNGGSSYAGAGFIIFSDSVQTDGCGSATSAVGPFYCPADSQVYLDQQFLDELQRRFGAPGDFAQAYVIAHEVGHHVQNITGISAGVREEQQRNPGDANELSIRLELQADCLAGVWGFSAADRGLLERGDVEEGLTAAAAVGDDNIQRQSSGSVNRESWTHGSSEQRVRWFQVGFETGDPQQCDTFSGDA